MKKALETGLFRMRRMGLEPRGKCLKTAPFRRFFDYDIQINVCRIPLKVSILRLQVKKCNTKCNTKNPDKKKFPSGFRIYQSSMLRTAILTSSSFSMM